MASGEESKQQSDLTCSPREENSESCNSTHRIIRDLKISRVMKKGIFYYNERILTLTSAPKLSYMSKDIEKVIKLNSHTQVKQLGSTVFEITNLNPSTKFRFKTFSEADCEDWVVKLQRIVQTYLSL